MTDAIPACPSGIYAITNTLNNKAYIGSAIDIKNRWTTHRWNLERNHHHSRHLQAAWNKYGAGVFTFTIIELVPDTAILIEREQHHMDARFALTGDIGYNNRATAANHLGWRHTPEALARMSKASKGRKHTPEQRAHMSALRKGNEKYAAISRRNVQKAGDVWRGSRHKPESVAKIKAKLTGQKRTPEQVYRITRALTGRKQSPETIAKRVAKNAGKKRPPEMVAAWRKRPLTEKQIAYRARLSIETAQRNRDRAKLPPTEAMLAARARLREQSLTPEGKERMRAMQKRSMKSRKANREGKLATITQPFLWPDES